MHHHFSPIFQLHHLMECCCRRKKFLEALAKNLGPCLLRALRDDSTLQSALCSMLELEVIENKDCQMQIITTLQSTPSGKQQYTALCQRQMHLRELVSVFIHLFIFLFFLKHNSKLLIIRRIEWRGVVRFRG